MFPRSYFAGIFYAPLYFTWQLPPDTPNLLFNIHTVQMAVAKPAAATMWV